MPYASEAQRKYMHAVHPHIASKWDAEIRAQKKGKGKVKKCQGPISDDPFFNQAAADKAFAMVMKMDDQTADMFTTMVVGELYEMDLERNLGTLQRHLDEVLEKRLSDLKRGAANAVVKSGGSFDADEFWAAIDAVEQQLVSKKKLTPKDYGYVWQESDFSRDPGTGRFRAKVTQTQTKPMHDKQFTAMTGGVMPEKGPDGKKMSYSQRAQYQDEYRQLASFLSMVNASTGDAGNREVLLHWQDNNRNTYSEKFNGTPDKADLGRKGYKLVGIEARPTDLTAGGAAFGLAGALGRPGAVNPLAMHGINYADEHGNQFANDWLSAGDLTGKNSNQRTYDRMYHSGRFLQNVAPGTKYAVAGRFAEIIGNHGPEAEAVLGPSARKAAYRYRGTEKRPDKTLVAQYGRAVNADKQRGALPSEAELAAARPRRGVAEPPPAQGLHREATAARARENRAPTWGERDSGRAVVLEYLQGRMPKKGLYGLQLESGNTPPSEGVIINANGQIASQASGYGDDHYLPFNLKNLTALKGGEYIRTRSVGGLTAEDVYTGLISGARRVTVTSRSGTYTVEFEPDFRGGRRHNDKARRMTRRYEQILDAVQSEKVDRGEIDPFIRDQITQAVKHDMPLDQGYRPQDQMDEINNRINEFKESPYISDEDQQYVERAVTEFEAKSPDTVEGRREVANYRSQLMDRLVDQKEVKFRLNSAGYDAAQQALQEQFPYYIMRAKWTPPRDTERRIVSEKDKGYVEPGRNRPTAARAGLHGTATNPGSKFSASHADYQGARSVQRGGTKNGKAAVEGTGGNEETIDISSKPQDVKAKRRAAAAKAEMERSFIEAAKAMQAHALSGEGYTAEARKDPTVQRMTQMSEEDLAKPENKAAFIKWAEGYLKEPGMEDAQGVTSLKRQWERATGAMDRQPYDKELGTQVYPKQPPTFKGDAYELGADPNIVRRELAKLDNKTREGIVNKVSLSSMDDAQYRSEWQALKEMHSALSDDPTPLTPDVLPGSVKRDSKALGPLLRDKKVIEQRMEDMQRIRSLTANLSPKEMSVYENRQAGSEPEPSKGPVGFQVVPGGRTEPKGTPHETTTAEEERAPHREKLDRDIDVVKNLRQQLRGIPEAGEDLDMVEGILAHLEEARDDPTMLTASDHESWESTDVHKEYMHELMDIIHRTPRSGREGYRPPGVPAPKPASPADVIPMANRRKTK